MLGQWKNIAVFICSLFISAPVVFGQPLQIAIQPQSEVTGDDIRLGDIAEIRAPTWQQMKNLGDIVINPAPAYGKNRVLSTNTILARLKTNKVDLSQIHFESPKEVVIHRRAVEITREEIEENVARKLKKLSWWDSENTKIKKIQIKNKLVLPEGNITYHIEEPKKQNHGNPIILPVTICVDKRYIKKITAYVYKDQYAEVVVVTNMLRRYQVISADDIILKKMNVNELSSNIILDQREVLGKRTKRAIYPKTVLRTDLVEMPPIIQRKDIINIIADTGKLRVTAIGEAQERGRKGDRIRVINTDSGEKIFARVVDPRTVRIEF